LSQLQLPHSDVNIQGNEKADEEAKAVAERKTSASNDLPTLPTKTPKAKQIHIKTGPQRQTQVMVERRMASINASRKA